jgi:hypothetical protein
MMRGDWAKVARLAKEGRPSMLQPDTMLKLLKQERSPILGKKYINSRRMAMGQCGVMDCRNVAKMRSTCATRPLSCLDSWIEPF